MKLTDRQESIKQAVIREKEYWHPFHEALLHMDPEFLASYLGMNGASVRANVIPRKVREFIYIAIDGSVNHMYEKGVQRHIEDALENGASGEEVLEVLQITCSLAHHTQEVGISILLEEMDRRKKGASGHEPLSKPSDMELKHRFETLTRYWPAWGDQLFRLAPEFSEGFFNFVSRPYALNALEPKVREFIYIALNAAPTTLYAPAVRRHIGMALDFGATGEEIADVLHCAGAIAIHSATIGMPHLYASLQKRGQFGDGG